MLKVWAEITLPHNLSLPILFFFSHGLSLSLALPLSPPLSPALPSSPSEIDQVRAQLPVGQFPSTGPIDRDDLIIAVGLVFQRKDTLSYTQRFHFRTSNLFMLLT